MPAKTKRRRRNTRERLAARAPWRALERHELDLIGLGLVALAAFFACIFYFGWNGGNVGQSLRSGLVYALGDVAYTAPVLLLGAALAILLGPLLPSLRPARAGTLCLVLGLLLGFGGNLFGLGGGPSARAGQFESPYFRHHGGALGDALYYAVHAAIAHIGAEIVFLFLLLAAALLLTGASVASIVAAGRRRAETLTRQLRYEASAVAAATERRTRTRTRPTADPPEVEPLVRATHVEVPPAEQEIEALSDEPEPFPQPEPEAEAIEEAEEPESELSGEAFEPPDPADLTPQGRLRASVTESDGFSYTLPRPGVLKRSAAGVRIDTRAQERVSAQLVEALGHFGVDARVVGTVAGPHVTRHELRLAPGTKMSKVAQLKDDLAYALAATDVRILAPIPGKQAVGVEVPNSDRRTVHLGDVWQAAPEGWSPLTVWLGKDIAGKAIGTDLAKQPHILVAGTTGSGKSGCINAMLCSVLLRASPNEVKLVLVDPKQVELNYYESIPHLITPVVTSPRLAANVLANLIKEMEERYGIMSRARTRNLVELNRQREREGERPLPYILCVIDELADLMMVAPGEVEDAIIRLAQKSRAVGIHLVLATQRPSADIITGMIKANVPARIAFAVSSGTDSRVILDQNGAESLLGQGDMLFRPASESRGARIQGAFITEEEIEKIVSHWRRQGEPELQEELLEAVESEEGESGAGGDFDPDADELLGEAIATVVQLGTASTSMLQRRLRVGYTRAGRLIDMLERRGVISGYEGSKARQVLITEADLPRVLAALDEPVAAEASPE